MRLLIDMVHPADAHFFKNPIRALTEAGHEIYVTSREKDCTVQLLDQLKIEHEIISRQGSGHLLAMAWELASRNFRLLNIARRFQPDVMAGYGGVSVAQVGWLLGIPSVVFYDTETAKLQNTLTYPFATRIVVPVCYTGKVPERKTVRYRGYHELSYLHPNHFQPDLEIALTNGLAAHGDTFLIRLVSWKASHDIGLNGWSPALLESVVELLTAHGRVVISSEGTLPQHLERLRYTGNPSRIHHVMAFCRAYIGESATMASEAVALGVPAVYAATSYRGYISEQQDRYHLAQVAGTDNPQQVLDALHSVLALPKDEVAAGHQKLLEDSGDVAQTVVEQITAVGL